jgi:hypothetical protein
VPKHLPRSLQFLVRSKVAFVPDTRAEWASEFVRSFVDGERHRRAFAGVEKYCFFVGYARSGHSLVGSLLNAHSEMVISQELNALRFVDHGFRRNQVFSLILLRDEHFAWRGRRSTGYDYTVPNQFQGSFTRLRVIGDKNGAASSQRLHKEPALLGRLQRMMQVPMRVLHVTRNPFDNIARMVVVEKSNLADMTEAYSTLCKSVDETREHLSADEFLDVRYEEFLGSPSASLASICKFLGVEADEGYLADCASIVQPSGKKARHLVEWTDEDRDKVSRLIDLYPVFRGYSFES